MLVILFGNVSLEVTMMLVKHNWYNACGFH